MSKCLGCGQEKDISYRDWDKGMGVLRFCYNCALELQLTDFKDVIDRIFRCVMCQTKFLSQNGQNRCSICIKKSYIYFKNENDPIFEAKRWFD